MSGVHYEEKQLEKQQLIQPAVVEQPQHFYLVSIQHLYRNQRQLLKTQMSLHHHVD